MDDRKFAAALRYRSGKENAPKITAKGRGKLAERIAEIANREGVPVREDEDLASILSLSNVGDEIPPELYTVVAEVFAFLYKVNGELKNRG